MILDACCGGLMMYRNMHKRLGDNFIYIDIRIADKEDYKEYTKFWQDIKPVKPLIKADMRYLPFRNGTFSVIICDPPHLDTPLNGWIVQKYGKWTQSQLIRIMRAANEEFKRVLKQEGTLILKVLADKLALYEILLTHFNFYLPIEYRSKSGHTSRKVGWYVATLQQTVQTEPSADDSGSLGQQDQQLPATQPRLEPSAP